MIAWLSDTSMAVKIRFLAA